MIRKCFLDLSSFVHKYIWEPFLGTHLRVKVNYQWQSFQKKKKRVSGLTLISNQILQKGTARTAAVLFPGLITFHCSLLMSQLSLSAHSPGSSGGLAVGQTASDSSIYIRGCLLCKDFQRLKKKKSLHFHVFPCHKCSYKYVSIWSSLLFCSGHWLHHQKAENAKS